MSDEIVGMLVGLLSLVFLFFKNKQANRSSPSRQEEEDDEISLEEIIQARRTPQKKPPPVPSPKKPSRATAQANPVFVPMEKKNVPFKHEIVTPKIQKERRLLPKITRHDEAHNVAGRPSRAAVALRRLTKLQDLVIYQEILSKPKSLRIDP